MVIVCFVVYSVRLFVLFCFVLFFFCFWIIFALNEVTSVQREMNVRKIVGVI